MWASLLETMSGLSVLDALEYLGTAAEYALFFVGFVMFPTAAGELARKGPVPRLRRKWVCAKLAVGILLFVMPGAINGLKGCQGVCDRYPSADDVTLF